MIENIRTTIVAAVLLWNSIYDWKYKKISVSITLTGIVIAVLFGITVPEFHNTIAEILGGISVGIFLIICSFITRGQIGIGDGIICCFIGIFCNFFENLSILFTGLLFSAMVSGFLLVSKKVGRKTELPLVPFLFLSYCFIQIL